MNEGTIPSVRRDVVDGNARGKCRKTYSQCPLTERIHAAEWPSQLAIAGAHRKLCAARREQGLYTLEDNGKEPNEWNRAHFSAAPADFSVFGLVRLVGDYSVLVNVDCISIEKVPPYRVAPIFGKIINFRLGENRAGKAITNERLGDAIRHPQWKFSSI